MTTTEPRIIAAENCHWYTKTGQACYEVPYADPRKGMRNTTLTDAKKLDLVPGYTMIADCEAKFGLVKYKINQAIDSALTLPRIEGETLDDYKVRVIADAEEHSRKARERGTELHTAIEKYILEEAYDSKFEEHIFKIETTFRQQCGLELREAEAETTFATDSYGGKIDWKQGFNLADFKTKDRIEHGKKLWYDSHVQQLAAYYKGSMPDADFKDARLISIFVGVDDKEVRIYEWPIEDITRCYEKFLCLLRFWQLDKKWKI